MVKRFYQPEYFGRQAKVWLGAAGLFLLLSLVFWMNSDADEGDHAAKPAKAATVIDPANLPSHIDTLGEVGAEVPPVNFESVTRDMRNYPAEFKDKSYFNTHRTKWTVQVMDVAEHKVIVDYLNGRGDRDKFAYFRYKDQNDKVRYILTYGVQNSFKEAAAVSNSVAFHLPDSAKAAPEEMKRYLTMIDSYQRVAEVVNVREEKPRQVNLTQTNKEVAPKAAEVSEADKAKAEQAVAQEQATEQKKEAPPPASKKDTAGDKSAEPDIAVPPTAKPVEEEAPAEKKRRLSNLFKKDKAKEAAEPAAVEGGDNNGD